MTIGPRPVPSLPLLLWLVIGCQDQSEPPSESPATTAAEVVPADTSPNDSAPELTATGWDDLEIGMTRAQVVAAAGEDAHPEAVGGPDPATCDEFRPDRAPEGLLVMIRNGTLSRIAIVDGPAIVTDRGIGVGDSVSTVEAAYDESAVVSPHPFLPEPAGFITVWESAPPSPDARGIAHEFGEDGRIIRILAGDESIEFREGCV